MLQTNCPRGTVPHSPQVPAVSKGTSKTSRLVGLVSIETITSEYRQRGYAGTLKYLGLTPTDYNLLTKEAPNRDELLTLNAQEVREFEASGVKLTGVFCSRGTAINLTKDLLFRELPGFEAASLQRDIGTMAELYRKTVIGFKAPSGNGTGQKAFFIHHGLGSIVANTGAMGLGKRNSVAALLGLVFPGLIDFTNSAALSPNEVERGYWGVRENVERHFFTALNTVPGFAEARTRGDINEMLTLWRTHISNYSSPSTQSGGATVFFGERGGLNGFLSYPHPKLGFMERGIRPLVKAFLPDFFDKVGTHADLRPDGYWQKAENVRAELLRALYEVPGFQVAHEAGDASSMCRLYREHVIGYRPRPGERGGQKLFFIAKGCGSAFRLRGGAAALGLSEGSFMAVVREVVPQLFSPNVPEHIQHKEVSARIWTPETMRSATLELLYTIPGFERAHKEGDVASMSALYRAHVVGYRSKSEGVGGQRAFFWENGLVGLIGNARADLGFQRKNSPYELMRLVVPEIFDPACPGALSERELTQYYWSVRENALKGILDALYLIDGFEDAHAAGDVARMADLYRAHIIGYRSSNGRGGQQAYFIEKGGLVTLFNKARENFGWSKAGSPAEGLRLALPELVDPLHPDALRRSEIEHYLIPDKETLREYLLSGLFTVVGFQEAFETADIAEMARLYREHVIGYSAGAGPKARGQVAFLREVCNLGPVLARRHPELGITRLSCPAQIVEAVLPGLIDANNPVALAPNEVQHSYWTLETVCSHALASLCRIPGFSDAYETRTISVMAVLYRECVIDYKASNGGLGGQYAFFREQAGIPLLAYVDQQSGERISVPPVALLDRLIPGLVSEEDPDALLPSEVRCNYWNDEAVVSRNVIRVLYALPGFREAHEEYDIAEMAQIYRREVIGYVATDGSAGSQKGFFAKMGLLAISNHKNSLGYERGRFFAEVVSSCIPGLVDDENPEALALNELSTAVWTDEQYIAQRIRLGLCTIPGFQEALHVNDIPRMAQLYEEHVRSFVDPATGERGQRAFFRCKARLGAGLNMGRYHGHSDANSMVHYLNLAVPGLVDADNSKALQPPRVTASYWSDEQRVTRLKQRLHAIPGWKAAEEQGELSVLASLYRAHVLSFYDPIRKAGGQTQFFGVCGLGAVSQHRTGRPFVEILNEAYPGLVDLTNPDMLHPTEVSKTNWKNIDSVRVGVLGALYQIPGFEDAHGAGDRARMASLYRSHVAGYRSVWSDYGGQCQWFIEQARMGGLLTSGRLTALGLPPEQSKNPCAALMVLACPEIASEVFGLQSERSARYVRGALYEGLCRLLCSLCEADVSTERVETRLQGSSNVSLYPDALVKGRIIDFKWGRAYQDICDTVVKYASVAALEVNSNKVCKVDEAHPIIIFVLEPLHEGQLEATDVPHRIISIADMLNPQCCNPDVKAARELMEWRHPHEVSSILAEIFDSLRRLQRAQPDDPDRNFYALNGLLEELFEARTSGMEELLDALGSFNYLVQDICA